MDASERKKIFDEFRRRNPQLRTKDVWERVYRLERMRNNSSNPQPAPGQNAAPQPRQTNKAPANPTPRNNSGSSGTVSRTSSGSTESGSLWWIFFSVLLYLSDLFVTGFNGLNFNNFLSVFSSINIKSITTLFFNAGVIAIIVAYTIFKKPSKSELISFFVLVELGWIIIFLGGLTFGSVLHILFAIAVWIWLISPQTEDKSQANFIIIGCIFVDFFLFSGIAKFATSLPYFNRLIIPVWFFLTLIYTKQNKWKSFLVFLVIMFYVFNAASAYGDFKKLGTDSLNKKEMQAARDFAAKSWDNMKSFGKGILDAILDLPKSIKSAQERMLAQAEGEYYTGEIDQNAKERLGVYIDEVRATDTFFYEDQPITIWGDLVAKTIEEPITINVGCNADKTQSKKAEVYPRSQFNISVSENEGIECTFPKGSLKKGNHEVGLFADFNFLTMAYIKTYFMDPEAKRALISQSIDPLDRYGITDKEPTPIYTAGPINIGLNVGSSLPLISNREFRLAITLMNVWEGKLKEVSDLYIITPKAVTMLNERDSGYYCAGKKNYVFKKSSCDEIGEDEKGCDDSRLHNIFRMVQGTDKIKDIDNFETILCRFNIADPSALLGGVPISTKYFKVLTRYNYSIHKEINVEVKAGDGVKTFLGEGDCSVKCPDYDNCFCPPGCVREENYEVSKDVDCGGPRAAEIPNPTTPQINTCNPPNQWTDICADCSGKYGDGTPIYAGIFCVNNKWVCTQSVNQNDATYHKIGDCPS